MKEIGQCDVASAADWISKIPFEYWPQQSRLEDGKLRPAMVTDLLWHDFGIVTDDLVKRISDASYNRMLSVVMPGHSIPYHRDAQGSEWVTRIHIPLLTNESAYFFDGDEGKPFGYQMKVGTVYSVDTRAMHAVENNGETPRVHLLFDIKR